MSSSERTDVTTPAVILKLDRNVMHHGGLGAIRSLGRLGVPVYGVHEHRLAPAAASRYLAGRYFWTPNPFDAENVRSGLVTLSERIGQRAVLIPTDDAGAIFLDEHGAGLRDRFAFAAPPAGLPRRAAGKHTLFQLCADCGVPAPDALQPDSAGQAQEFAAAAGYPVIAKLTTPWSGGGLPSTTVVRSPGQLGELWAAAGRAGTGLLLQEFIPASPGGDWFFHGYCDAASACRPAFTGIKERSYPAYAGLTSYGRSAPNLALRGELTGLLRRLGYAGIVDLDLRLDPRDGKHKLLDFNPRLGAQFRLFRDAAGTDVVTAAYLDLTGQPVPAAPQVYGRRFLAENYDPIAALRYWRDGELSGAAWLASVRRADELAWFAGDDLRPFGLMCLRMAGRGVTRPLTRPLGRIRVRPGAKPRELDLTARLTEEAKELA